MEELLRFLEQYEAWVYALLGVVAFIYVRKLIADWQEWRSSIFGLERESAQRRLSATLTVVVIISLLAAAEFVLVSFVAPVYPVANILQTPTVSVLTTPTEAFGAVGENTGEGIALIATQAVESAGGCVPGVLEWTFPVEGETVSGVVRLKGTAILPNMGFFKYEFTEVSSDSWVTIAASNTPAEDIELGNWNTQTLVPGDYRLRLVMTDNQNQALPACEITVRVLPPSED